MKIAQVVCVYPPYAGGIGTSALKLQNLLSKQHESFVFTPKNEHEASKSDKENNIIRLNPLFKLGHGAILFSLIKELKKFDIIYFHYPFFGTGIIIWLFKILNPNKKIIIHYHMDVCHKNIVFKILSWPEEIIKKSLFKKSEYIITASLDYIKNSQIKNIYLKYPNKFKEIPFSVDTEKFRPLNIANKENNILFVGGLDKAHYFKGVDLLITAVSQLKIDNYKLLIAGDGNLRKDLEAETKKLNISDKVNFLGKLSFDELVENYQKSKVLVLPSINSNEAFGIVLIEAMACGVPVIASNLPGVRTVFKNGKSGLMIEPANIIDLKEKIEIILQDEEKQIKMGQEARNLVLEKYSEEVVNSKILQLFD